MQQKYLKAMRAAAATGAAFLLNYLIQMVLTPYITETVGADAYGFVTLAKNFAQYAAILTAALNSFAARHIAVAYHNKDYRKANAFFSSAFFGDMILASGLLLIAAFLIAFLERILQIPAALVAEVKTLFLYVFVNFWIVTVLTVFESAAYIQSKLDTAGLFKGLSYLTEALILGALFLLAPARVSYVGIGMICASLVVGLGNLYLCRRYTPELSIKRKDFSFAAVKKLVIDGIWTSINSLGEILNSGLDLIVCNLLLTPLHMGQVAIAKTVHSMFYGLFVIINPAFQPMFLKSYAEKDKPMLLEELKLAMKVSSMLSNIAFSGFLALGLAFYRLWIPHQDTKIIYELTLINCLTLIPGGPMQPLYYIYTLTMKKKVPCFITIAGGICNVAGMYLLIKYTGLGVYSVVLTTAVVMMFINFITNPLYMAHVLNLPRGFFYPVILKSLFSCGMLSGLFYGLSRCYQPENWLAMILTACLYAAAGAVIHLFIVCSRSERRRLVCLVTRKDDAHAS